MSSKNDDWDNLIPKGMSDGWRFAVSLIMLVFYLIALPFQLIMLTVGYVRDIIFYFKKPPTPPNTTPQLEADTREIVEKLKPHKLAKDDPLSPVNYASALTLKAFDDYPGASFELVKALAEVIVPLIEQERFLEVPVPTPTEDIVEQAKYRDELRKVITKHRNFIETKRCFDDAIIESMKAFLQHLPPAAFSMEGNTTISLEDLIENPGKLLWDIVSPFYTNDILQRHLFKQLTDQIDENVRMQKDVLPQDAKGTTTELFNKYLYNTPLRKITNAQIPFEIPDRFLPEHRLVVAGTGSGKSMFIQQDVYHYLQRENRPSIVIIDSMGRMLPKLERLNIWKDDLIIIDPTDINPPALSIFAQPKRIKSYDANMQAIILSDRIKLFTFFFSSLGVDLSGRQSIFFSFAMRLILSIPDASLFHLFRLLQEEPKTAQASEFWPYIERLDEHTRLFFEDRFFKKGFNSETKGLLSDRIHGIISNPAFARMLTAKENKLDLFEAINSGKTILVNTAKSFLGDTFPIFGRYFIASTLGAAFQRAAMPEPYPLTLLYVDEASEYMQDKTLAELFTKARQFNLGALVAYQSVSQLKDLRSDILANTSTKLVSGIEPKEADDMIASLRTSKEFLLSLKKKDKSYSEFACYVKGYTSHAVKLKIPFGVIEDAPKMSKEEHQALRQRNRERYGTSTSANVSQENNLSQTHEAPAKKAPNEVSRQHPTAVNTTSPPAPYPATDPHAGVDD